MRITPRSETPSFCSPTPIVSEEASDVLAPCPGCRLAACDVLVFLQNCFEYVICEFGQLGGRYGVPTAVERFRFNDTSCVIHISLVANQCIHHTSEVYSHIGEEGREWCWYMFLDC